jgi:hypothetical protein
VTSPNWVGLALSGLGVVGAFALVTLLALFTIFSWRVTRLSDPDMRRTFRALRQKLILPFWIAGIVAATAGIYMQLKGAPIAPSTFASVGDISEPYGDSYVLLFFGMLMFLVQVFLGMAVVTWRLGVRDRLHQTAPTAEVGTALISTLSLVASFLALGAAAALGYVGGVAG